MTEPRIRPERFTTQPGEVRARQVRRWPLAPVDGNAEAD